MEFFQVGVTGIWNELDHHSKRNYVAFFVSNASGQYVVLIRYIIIMIVFVVIVNIIITSESFSLPSRETSH